MDLKKYRIGMRTIKTAIAVSIGLFIAEVFNLQSPLFVGIGAIHAMQATVSESFETGKNRILGTVVGGLIALIFALYLPRNQIFMGIGIILVIHILNLVGWKKAISLSAIVFIAVSLNHDFEMIPYAVSRVLDTFVGIAIGVLVNYFVAAPSSNKMFEKYAERMILEAKDYTYKLVVGKQKVDLKDFKSELAKIEKAFDLIQSETKIKIVKDKDLPGSEITLGIIYDIYSDLSALQMMQHIAIISPDNIDLLERLYSFTPIWEKKAIIGEKDIIFNYHLQRLLKNIIYMLDNDN
ncbi:MAG: aromatic acid exporter family protein [Gudongella sp.]|nr:aromatic acid exporter family protein [Gudongella sp.]